MNKSLDNKCCGLWNGSTMKGRMRALLAGILISILVALGAAVPLNHSLRRQRRSS